jgi:ATP-dependent helicase HrpA
MALQLKDQMKYLEKNVPGMQQMGMQFMALGSQEELRDQIIEAGLERAFLQEPPILVCDEPTHALDDHSATQVVSALRQYHGLVIVATHDPRLIAVADDIWALPSR